MVYGNVDNFYYIIMVKVNFNFFQNLLYLQDFYVLLVSSFILGLGILFYKYKFEDQYEENGWQIFKIRIIFCMSFIFMLLGYIYVIDIFWLIQKLELIMEKGNFLIYDYFIICQWFDYLGDLICLFVKQEMDYGVKYKDQSLKMIMVVIFFNYQFNLGFVKKYFWDEVGSMVVEVYECDFVFWQEKCVVLLMLEEQCFIVVCDFLCDVYLWKEYFDFIDCVFNKVIFWKVVWFGVEYWNCERKS